MKEKLYTIPLNDAFKEDGECPFCNIERSLEEHTLDFVLGPGASYMEDDVRAETDAQGFCRAHYKKLYDYGNRLGTGLILSSRSKCLLLPVPLLWDVSGRIKKPAVLPAPP